VPPLPPLPAVPVVLLEDPPVPALVVPLEVLALSLEVSPLDPVVLLLLEVVAVVPDPVVSVLPPVAVLVVAVLVVVPLPVAVALVPVVVDAVPVVVVAVPVLDEELVVPVVSAAGSHTQVPHFPSGWHALSPTQLSVAQPMVSPGVHGPVAQSSSLEQAALRATAMNADPKPKSQWRVMGRSMPKAGCSHPSQWQALWAYGSPAAYAVETDAILAGYAVRAKRRCKRESVSV